MCFHGQSEKAANSSPRASSMKGTGCSGLRPLSIQDPEGVGRGPMVRLRSAHPPPMRGVYNIRLNSCASPTTAGPRSGSPGLRPEAAPGSWRWRQERLGT